MKKEYTLSALEVILINKLMPLGTKLERVENIQVPQRVSQSTHTQPSQHQEHSSKNYSPQTKCEMCIKRILANELSNSFYIRTSSNEPSLSQIEKNVHLGKYKTFSSLESALQNLWLFYLEHYSNNAETSEKAKKMSEISDNIIRGLDPQLGNTSTLQKYNSKQTGILNKTPMSIQEKLGLVNNINRLQKHHLKKLADIVAENAEFEKESKHLVFDIETLNPLKCRELENYVRACLGDNYVEQKKVNEKKNINEIKKDEKSSSSSSYSD